MNAFLTSVPPPSFGLGLREGARVRVCNAHLVRHSGAPVALAMCARSSIDVLAFSPAATPLSLLIPNLFQTSRLGREGWQSTAAIA